MKSEVAIKIIKKFTKLSYFLINYIKFFFTKKSKKENKLLFVYDLTVQPLSVGDFLIQNISSIIVAKLNRLQKIDLLIIYDLDKNNEVPESSFLNKDNILPAIDSILPIAKINKYISSVLIYDKYENAIKLINEKKYYKTYPKICSFYRKKYLYWNSINILLPYYFHSNGDLDLDLFKFSEITTNWIDSFKLNFAKNKLLVTVNIRNNSNYGFNRNSNSDEWIKFFKYAYKNYNVIFIILCSTNEIQQKWRSLKNVIVFRDFSKSIEFDLALIAKSNFHIGTASGPFTMAWFGKKPYLMFNTEIEVMKKLQKSFYKYEDYYRFTFSNKNQKLIVKEDSFTNIVNEFNKIYESEF